MRNLEQRSGAEGLGELSAQAREARVVQEDIALHFSRNVLDCAGVGEPQCLSPLLECFVCILELGERAGVRSFRFRDQVGDSLFLRGVHGVELQWRGHDEDVRGYRTRSFL
jgi:hypothetical protein